MEILARPEFARALSASFAADMERNPSIKLALAGGRLDRDGLVRVILGDPERFPLTNGFIRRVAREQGIRIPAGLGQWEALGSIVTAVAGAATKVYGSKVEADLQKRLAELEMQKQQAAIRTAELQAKIAQAQYQTAEAAARQTETQVAQAQAREEAAVLKVLGIPWWGVALGVAGVGTVGYLLLKPKSRSRR